MQRDATMEAAQGATRPALGRTAGLLILAIGATALWACTPTVRVEAPKEPITINLNIQADVRVKVEQEIEDAIEANPGIF